MLGKLFKYELRSGAEPVPALLAALVIVYLLGRLADTLQITQIRVAMSVASVGIGIAALVLGLIYVVSRCAKGLYGAEGYLMQTLPVSHGKLIAVKVICGYLVLLMSGVVFVAGLAGCLALNDMLGTVREMFGALGNVPVPLLAYILGSAATQLLAAFGSLYFAVAIANTRALQRNGILMAIVFYFVCSTVIGLVELVAIVVLPIGIVFSPDGAAFSTTPMLVSLFSGGLPGQVESVNELYGVTLGMGNLLADVLMGIGLLIAARWVMEHKASVK